MEQNWRNGSSHIKNLHGSIPAELVTALQSPTIDEGPGGAILLLPKSVEKKMEKQQSYSEKAAAAAKEQSKREAGRFKCSMVEFIRYHRTVSQSTLEKESLDQSLAPKLLRWNFPVYESFSMRNIILFTRKNQKQLLAFHHVLISKPKHFTK